MAIIICIFNRKNRAGIYVRTTKKKLYVERKSGISEDAIDDSS